MEPEIFDTTIIGAGPAGISAAIYVVRKSLKVLLVSKDIGGQAALSGDIENYPGFSLITGPDLALKFKDEIKRFANDGLWIKEGVEVTGIEGAENNFSVKTASGDFKTKTVIVASGRIPKMLGIPGEKEFLGRGVSTCSTCDAPLYKDKYVVVVGGGNSALDAAFSLMKVAFGVTIVNNMDGLRGDNVILNNVLKSPKVRVLNNHEVVEIKGLKGVESVSVKSKINNEVVNLPAQGVFIEIGWKPASDFLDVAKNKKGEIIVSEFGKTSIEGIYAAGDVNNLWGEQIVIACGEGAKVALIVAEHIAKIPHQMTSNLHEG